MIIRDNIKRGSTKSEVIVVDNKPVKVDNISITPYSNDQLNDICYDLGVNDVLFQDVYSEGAIISLTTLNNRIYGIIITYTTAYKFSIYTVTSNIVDGLLRFSYKYRGRNYTCDSVSVVGYDGLIHVFYGYTGANVGRFNHSTWDGISMVDVPCNDVARKVSRDKAIVYNDKLYLMNNGECTNSNSNLIRWNGADDDTWTAMSLSPYMVKRPNNTVVYDGAIHIISEHLILNTDLSIENEMRHLMWVDNTWTDLTNIIPVPVLHETGYIYINYRRVYADDLYVYHGNMFYRTYMLDGDVWVNTGTTDYTMATKIAYNSNEVHALVYDVVNDTLIHYCNPGNRYKCVIKK